MRGLRGQARVEKTAVRVFAAVELAAEDVRASTGAAPYLIKEWRPRWVKSTTRWNPIG